MKILIIGPLPTPTRTTGQAIAVKLFVDTVSCSDKVVIVDLFSENSTNSFKLRRVLEAINLFWRVLFGSRTADVIYFTISESFLGNLKDILLYSACILRLDRIVVHLHGGEGMRQLLSNRKSLLFLINRFFLSRCKRVIVLGPSLVNIFDGCVPRKMISVVPNFAEKSLFVSNEQIATKFSETSVIKFLFLSNLLPGKGHFELLQAFCDLSEQYKSRIEIGFAGEILENHGRSEFLSRLAEFNQLTYHGTVFGERKRELFECSHVFCLPTFYPFEGQPISILEAYASGCVVISTYHSGIIDIFKDNVNGYRVDEKSVKSLQNAIMRVVDFPQALFAFGRTNSEQAKSQYTTGAHLDALLAAVKD